MLDGRVVFVASLLLFQLSCMRGPGLPEPGDPAGDIESTHVLLDLAARTGRATLVASTHRGLTLDVRGLQIIDVTDGSRALTHEEDDGLLRVALRGTHQTVVVRYRFGLAGPMEGFMATGSSLTWPDHCGNLFPCHPDPADGARFHVEVRGVPDGQLAITTPALEVEAPAYMPAVAVGPYTEASLGTTSAGTRVVRYTLPGGEAAADVGTADLVAVVDFLERAYGPYAYGGVLGPVEVRWPSTSFAGMEHHPYFHVGAGSMDDPYIHAHEAAHGWFGNAVRIACAEDFVLSEGVTTYAALRALEAITATNAWDGYASRVRRGCGLESARTAAMPSTCGVARLGYDAVSTQATYAKGACFLRDVAEEVGPAALDATIGRFYRAHRGQATEMEVLIDAIREGHPDHRDAVDALVVAWLTGQRCPVDAVARCRRPLLVERADRGR